MTRGLVVTLIAVTLGTACTRSESPAGAAAAKPLTTVKMNVNPSMTYAPMMVAKEEGYFAAEGIDAEFVSIDANSALVAVTTGKIDVLSGPIRSGIFNMMLKGVPLQIVADKGHAEPTGCVTEAFAAPPALADRIAANGGSVRGQKFALIRGGFTEFMIDKLIEKQHLTRKDIQFVQIPQGDSFASQSKVLEAIRYVQEPMLSNHLSNGSMKVIASSEEVSPDHQHGVVVFGQRLLKDEPELGRRFMRAYLRGVRRYNEGKTPRNVDIISRGTRLSPDIIRRSCWLPIANDGQVRQASMQEILDWSRKLGYLQADVPRSQWWNSSYIDAANASLARTESQPVR